MKNIFKFCSHLQLLSFTTFQSLNYPLFIYFYFFLSNNRINCKNNFLNEYASNPFTLYLKVSLQVFSIYKKLCKHEVKVQSYDVK